ncbi:hypothetical protein CHUAL_004271 [Chamberlinius hualienensis]
MAALNVKPQAVQRIKSLLNDNLYKEAVEHSASYNTRLCIERKMRLPFLDAQTGVAQNNCYLWMNRRNRMPGEKPGQIYTYPSKRWRKRRRQYLVNFLRPRIRDYDLGHDESNQGNSMDGILKAHGDDDRDDRLADDSKDSWYREFDDIPDPPDAGELDDPESEFDDYEETYSKRKKKKGPTRGKKRSMGFDPATEAEKPYQCDICGARYKTRPGLSYHYSHSHINSSDTTVDEDSTVSASPKPPPAMSGASTSVSSNDPLTGPNKLNVQPAIVLSPITTPLPPVPQPQQPAPTTSTSMPMIPTSVMSAGPPPPPPDVVPVPNATKTNASPSPYCDFCLGDSIENKKTRQAEDLVSCSDCGRSGHPSCLQFTPNMIISVKKYRWQCIECKCCTLCGTSDNDVIYILLLEFV